MGIEIFRTEIMRQVQCKQTQIHGLIERRSHTMPIVKTMAIKLTHAPANTVSDGKQLFCDLIDIVHVSCAQTF